MAEERWRWYDETNCRSAGDQVPWMRPRWTNYLIGNYPRRGKGRIGDVARANYMNALYVLRNQRPPGRDDPLHLTAEDNFHRGLNCVIRTLEAEQRGEVEVLDGMRRRSRRR